MDSNRFKYGIVFCGGGTKGAYQIGVWKRLKELGVDKEITGVSGASIGAMNSMLFAQGDYDAAEEVWIQTKQSDMKPWNLSALQSAFQGIISHGLGRAATGALLTTSLGLANPLFSVVSKLSTGAVAVNIYNFLKNASLYTPDRLKDMLYKYISPERIAATNKRVYTALTSIEAHMPDKSESSMDSYHPACRFFGQIEYRSWAGLTYDEIVETVLASAALPGAYPASRHNGKTYIDGGVLDNTPVKPLRDVGFRNIIVVHLDYISDKKKRQKQEEMVNSQGSGWVRFMHIWPSSAEIGDKMKINAELTRRRINLGYMDTESQLRPYLKRDAETHYSLARKIYMQLIREAAQAGERGKVLALLQTEKGSEMLRNYEYAADLGHEEAKAMVKQIRKLQNL